MSEPLSPGLYEQVINQNLQKSLKSTPDSAKLTSKIDPAESTAVLTQYVSQVLQKALDRLPETDDLEPKITLVNKLVELISSIDTLEDLKDLQRC